MLGESNNSIKCGVENDLRNSSVKHKPFKYFFFSFSLARLNWLYDDIICLVR